MKIDDLTKNEIQVINTINKNYSSIIRKELNFFLSPTLKEDEIETAVNSLLYKQLISYTGNYLTIDDNKINQIRQQEEESTEKEEDM